MSIPSRLILSSAVWLLFHLAPVSAAPVTPTSPLAQIPDNAFLTIQLHGIDRTLDRFEAMIRAMSPELHKQMQSMLKDLRKGFDGRQWKGLAKEGPHFLVLFGVPDFEGDEEPKIALILRTTNYRTFRDSFLKEDEARTLEKGDGYELASPNSEPIYLVDRKEYTVLTPRKDTAKKFTEKFKGLDTRISATQSKRLLDSDLGLYLSVDPQGAEYADVVKESKRFLADTLDGVENMLNVKNQPTADLVRHLMDPLFQAVEDSQGVVLTLDFKPTSFAIHLDAEPRKGSKTGRALKDQRVSALGEVGKLPEGSMTYSAWNVSDPLLKEVGPWLVGVPPRSEKKQTEALAKLLKAGPAVRVEAFDPVGTGVQSWSFADPSAAVDAHLSLYQMLAKGDAFYNMPLRRRAIVTQTAEKSGDIAFHRVQLGWDLDRAGQMLRGVIDRDKEEDRELTLSIKKQIGDEGNVWLGGDGKRLLQVRGREWATAEKVLSDYLKGASPLEKQEAYQSVRKELPTEATVLLFVEMSRYVDWTYAILKPLTKGTPRKPLPRDDKSKPGYVGVAITLQPERMSLDVAVTTEAAREVMRRCYLALFGIQ